MRLKDKIVVVTASTSGIGLAIVKACAMEGASVYMAARNLEKAEAIKDDLEREQLNVKVVYYDAKNKDTAQAMIEEVATKEGKIDVLVNNFGLSDPIKDLDIVNTAYDTFIEAIDLNLSSVYLTTQSAIKYMSESGGSIINISSLSGSIPDLTRIAYGSSKATINFLTRQIAVQCARYKIRCNAILPGVINTDAVKSNLPELYRSLLLKHTPISRIGEPEEIASAVVYFANDDSLYITGQLLEVSGGYGLAAPIYGDLMNIEK